MKRILLLLFAMIVIIILSMAPVHAGWFDFLFKGAAKQAEKQIIKQEEKTVVKQAERNTIKQEEKQVTKPAQILINKEFGNALDDAFKTAWCKNYRCTTKFTDIRVNALGTDTVYIIDDYAAQKFIQRNYQLDYVSAFNRRPDMLRIKTTDGRVTSIVMYDVKTTKNAVAAAEQRGQGKDYANFCQKLNLAQGKNFCKVQYVLPEEEVIHIKQVIAKADDGTLACSVVNLGIDAVAGAIRGTSIGLPGVVVGSGVGIAMCFVDGPKLFDYLKYTSSY